MRAVAYWRTLGERRTLPKPHQVARLKMECERAEDDHLCPKGYGFSLPSTSRTVCYTKYQLDV
jgi:hypothetical protein